MATTTSPTTTAPDLEILLAALAERRGFLLHTATGLTDDQARATATVSTLSIGGLLKHVSLTERAWALFARDGAQALGPEVDYENLDWGSPAAQAMMAEREREFTLLEDETLAQVVADYQETARRTEDLVRGLADPDRAYPLPPAPWYEPGAAWSVRHVLAHLIGETAQHAGHADIIRESIDGQKTMD